MRVGLTTTATSSAETSLAHWEHEMNRRESLKLLAASGAITAASAWSGRNAVAQTMSPAQPAATPPAGPFKLPPLGYAYEALEPHIDAMTMNIHHTRHHQAYVTGLNQLVT